MEVVKMQDDENSIKPNEIVEFFNFLKENILSKNTRLSDFSFQ